MNPIRVSVIIPVYNVEPYLRQCLDSVISQSLTEIEIICINDGSTDHSLEILKEYKARDRRVRIIDKKNEGQGPARNIAVREAAGEYIGFVDSDDWIDPAMFRELYDTAGRWHNDIVMCEYKLYDGKTNKMSQPEATKIPIDPKFDQVSFHWSEITEYLFLLNSGPCNKIFKTEFVKSIDARFAEGLYYEDILFVFKCLIHSQSICLVRKPLYFQRYLRPDSATADKGKRRFDIFKILQLLEKEIYRVDDIHDLRLRFQEYKIGQLLFHLNEIRWEYKKEFLSRILSERNHKDTNSNSSIQKLSSLTLYKIWLLEKIKVLTFRILGKQALKYVNFYRALQSGLMK